MSTKLPSSRDIILYILTIYPNALNMKDTEFRAIFDEFASKNFGIQDPQAHWQNWSVERVRKAIKAERKQHLTEDSIAKRPNTTTELAHTTDIMARSVPINVKALVGSQHLNVQNENADEGGKKRSQVITYDEYKARVTGDIEKCIDTLQCRPILFIGTGFSRRIFSAPSWVELLHQLCDECPNLDKDYLYYEQLHNGNLIDVAESFVKPFMDWAWGDGRSLYPEELFKQKHSPQIYLKQRVADQIRKITPPSTDLLTSEPLYEEIKALQLVRPHAAITTNYDTFLEVLFPEYRPIVGQMVLRADPTVIGDILKIHGCVTEPESLVLTRQDYDVFIARRKYLSAKLLAYFAEHPLLFVGYSINDPNIQNILADIDEIVAPNGELIPNIYFLRWEQDVEDSSKLSTETVISIGNGRHIRIKEIVATDFAWVFKAFSHGSTIEPMDVRVLRNLLSRVQRLVRTTIPTGEVRVDYNTLEGLLEKDGEIEKVIGICSIDDPSQVNADYRYLPSQLAETLGCRSCYHLNKLIEKVKTEKGIDIKASDNRYHIGIKTGRRNVTHKYTDAAIELLRKVSDDEEYVVDVPVKANLDISSSVEMSHLN